MNGFQRPQAMVLWACILEYQEHEAEAILHFLDEREKERAL